MKFQPQIRFKNGRKEPEPDAIISENKRRWQTKIRKTTLKYFKCPQLDAESSDLHDFGVFQKRQGHAGSNGIIRMRDVHGKIESHTQHSIQNRKKTAGGPFVPKPNAVYRHQNEVSWHQNQIFLTWPPTVCKKASKSHSAST